MGTTQTMRSAATGHGRGRRLLLVVLAFLACFAAAGTPATAGPPVEHSGKATFVDPTFSEFLTQSCGFAVAVTDTESDTLLDNGTVFMLSIPSPRTSWETATDSCCAPLAQALEGTKGASRATFDAWRTVMLAPKAPIRTW
ncbi:hypothetical protein [Pedococcus bigeumensis]|uniref:hypothetical protein n=1 Tax=Pedococcus bigeumensis TaxID=433644 RepID=UPI002FE9720E